MNRPLMYPKMEGDEDDEDGESDNSRVTIVQRGKRDDDSDFSGVEGEDWVWEQ